MLPVFPLFKNLQASDKISIEKITSQFLPYSDFNFLSMWSWDASESVKISELNGNLVVRFVDYVTKQPFFSFIGKNSVSTTAKKVLELSRSEGLSPKLSLVPEDVVKNLNSEDFIIQENREHFDYIYPIDELLTYRSPRHKKQREAVNGFNRKYSHRVEQMSLSERPNHKMLLKLFDRWVENKASKSQVERQDYSDHENEYSAFQKLLNAPHEIMKSVICFSVFIDGELSAFMIDERASEDYSISHFGKLNKDHRGNLQILMQNSASAFADMGVKFYNDEQDLGIDSLRTSKSSYILDHFLKKYTVSFR